jgi:hypothetical protein
MTGLIPGHAEHLLHLDLVVLLAFLEGVVCENEDNARHIQQIYDDHKPRRPRPATDRRAEVAAFMAMA